MKQSIIYEQRPEPPQPALLSVPTVEEVRDSAFRLYAMGELAAAAQLLMRAAA
jgi:hypothetical protein